MNRLIVIVEGQTEEVFVNQILSSYLASRGYSSARARLMGESCRRGERGGVRAWSFVRRRILRHLKEDRGCVVSTMVDYYGLPLDGRRAWPCSVPRGAGPEALLVEEGMRTDIATEGIGLARRFIPYVAMYEFEALLFSDCSTFGRSIEREDIVSDLERIRRAFVSPEAIDDSPTGAPSKRIARLIADYNKPFHGNIAALEIGVEKMRAECPHFAEWLDALEGVVATLAATRRP